MTQSTRARAMTAEGDMREQERLAALDGYDILDTPSEEAFDRITRLTRRIFDVPMSTVTLIDGHRQWFKSRQGLAACETPKGPALCNIAIGEPYALIVPDTRDDARFATNPFVIGAPNIRFYAGIPLRSPAGHAVGTLCAMDTRPRSLLPDQVETLADLGRIVMSELELRLLAMTDSLTGTLSRRAFRDEFARAIALALRYRHELTCIMLDLDHFKSVNDRYGHSIGDLVLTATTAACHAELRRSDAFGRMGGEEFAILMPYTGLAAALKVAEKLRAVIAALRIPTPAGIIQVTASFGLSTLDDPASDIDTLLQRADDALYEAKAAGRNQCRRWQSTEIVPLGSRHRVLKAGRISFDGDRSAVDCTVRSLSDESASLKIVTTDGLPETFRLLIASDDFSRTCRIVTKADQLLDVAFV